MYSFILKNEERIFIKLYFERYGMILKAGELYKLINLEKSN